MGQVQRSNAVSWAVLAASLVACSAPKVPDHLQLLLDLQPVVEAQPGAKLPESGFDPIGRSNEYAAYVDLIADEDRRDVREALLTPADVEVSYEVEVPDADAPALRLALGWSLERESRSRNEGHRVDYSLVLEHGDESKQLISEHQRTGRRGRWRPRSIDLAAWRGRRVTLTFAGSAPTVAAAAWANPEIVSGRVPAPASGPNLIFISLDTLRADRLGVYGYEGDTSPNLDGFAAGAYTFLDATAQSTWTRPSHLAMFTGLYPESLQGMESKPLAELLRAEGWRTEAWTGGVQLHPKFRFHRGFQRFQIRDWVADPQTLVERLRELESNRFFLFLHTYEPHDPYDHPELAAAPAPEASRVDAKFDVRINNRLRPLKDLEKQRASQLYDADIRYLDGQLAPLFEALEQSGLSETTVVVITSDHGEEFWEHGLWFHGKSFYRASIEVPLIVYLPEAIRRRLDLPRVARIRQPVRLIDLYPTLAEILDVDLEHQVQGRTITGLLRGENLPGVPIYSEGLFNTDDEGRSIREGNFKLVWRFQDGVDETPRLTLFDLARDPAETQNVADRHPEVVKRLLATMATINAGKVEAQSVDEGDLDPEHRERLRALGYL